MTKENLCQLSGLEDSIKIDVKTNLISSLVVVKEKCLSVQDRKVNCMQIQNIKKFQLKTKLSHIQK